jgi:predicted RNase H-like HicB family nuclease
VEKLIIRVEWCGKNYAGLYADDKLGIVISTGRTLDKFKTEFAEAMDFHIDGMIEDGDDIPQWAATKQYEIEYDLHFCAMLHHISQYVSLAAISRVSGISKKQLEDYAAARKSPRLPQQEKIKKALRTLGEEILSITR